MLTLPLKIVKLSNSEHPYLPLKKGTLQIPVDLLNDFLLNPAKAMRDFASIPTEAISQFYGDVSQEIGECTINSEYNLLDSEKISIRDLKRPDTDDYRRYVHIDLGLKKDAVGFSMCHVPHYVDVVRKNMDNGIYEPILMPKVKFDFTARILARKGEEIDLSRFREILIDLRDKYYYNIALITFDRYQSADSVQMLRNLGFVVGHLSIDRTAYVVKVNYDKADFIEKVTTDKNYATPHEMFKSAMSEKRVLFPAIYPKDTRIIDEEREWTEKREILSQEYDSIKNTVTKSFHGTDDWLQSVVGSLCNAITNELSGSLYNDDDVNTEKFNDSDDPYDLIDPYSNYDLGDNIHGENDLTKYKKNWRR